MTTPETQLARLLWMNELAVGSRIAMRYTLSMRPATVRHSRRGAIYRSSRITLTWIVYEVKRRKRDGELIFTTFTKFPPDYPPSEMERHAGWVIPYKFRDQVALDRSLHNVTLSSVRDRLQDYAFGLEHAL